MTNRQLLERKAATLNEAEIAEVLEYITIMESLREQARRSDLFTDRRVKQVADAAARRAAQRDRTRRQPSASP